MRLNFLWEVILKPFDAYPEGGNTILKRMGRTNARREDGLWLMKNALQDRCAYCGVSLVDEYHHWLLLNVDHVIPVSECSRLGIPRDWHHSFTNAVLACFGCNLFDNRYTIQWTSPKPEASWTVSDFIVLRNEVFEERMARVSVRRVEEIEFFNRLVRRH